MDRKPAKVIVEGLVTKSDKIRELAREGYSRVEISNFLAIRYQHVRNVLIQAGIEAGTRNDLGKQRAVPVPPAPEPWPIERLLSAGFERLGDCKLLENSFEYSEKAPNKPGVYAFAVDGFVTYIGLTRGTLRTRLGHYIYGHAGQKTSYRIKGLILEALGQGRAVSACIALPPQFDWNGLPVYGPAGLETGLIRMVRPPWNQLGAS
jgi:hypothetical protein